MNKKITTILNKVRGKTDDSLIKERGKTDRSLIDAKQKAEGKTDQIVKSARNTADRGRAQARRKIDVERNAAEGSDSQNRLLSKERKSADKVEQKKRDYIDSAMDEEREKKNELMEDMLSKERGATDYNLKDERRQTDSEAMTAAISLTSRDEILAIVSHDLKNPIATICTTADLLIDDATQEQVELLKMIRRNATTAIKLINDILDIEKLAEGKFQLKLKVIDANEIIDEAVENFERLAATKNLKIVGYPADIAVNINCDRERIMQVLSNLIGNAVKFTPEGGKISVILNDFDNEVQFSVSDTGPGIPPDKVHHIFERFAQLGSTDRTGLGLGLYISKILTEVQQGKLWVDSKLEKGSVFTFSIPKNLKVVNAA